MARFILTLVRHGQTIYNQDGIIQGQMDVPLSEEGRRQIWLLAKALEQHRFTKIFASDLQRASETAQAVVDYGTVERPKVITDQRLRERGYGRLEGIPVKEYQGHAKKEKQRIQFTPEGGETIDQVRKRAVSFFKELCDEFLEGNMPKAPLQKCKLSTCPCTPEDGTAPPREPRATPPDSSAATTGLGASSETDSPPVEFTIGTSRSATSSSSDDDDDEKDTGVAGDRSGPADGPAGGKAQKHREGGAAPPPPYHKQSPHSNRYAPNVTLSQAHMEVGGMEPLEGSIEISYSEDSLCSQDTDDFDEEADAEGMVADILVVAHGVLIRELMKYFIEELNCFVPKGQSLANRVTFNTGMSRFQVDLLDGFPKMECLSIHQIDHLHQP